MLLADLRPHLRRLLMSLETLPSYTVDGADVQDGGLLAGAPPSWALARRVSKPVSSVQLVWQLDVSELRDAARRCAAQQSDDQALCAPESSPPLGGISFFMKFYMKFEDGGVRVDFFGLPESLPHDMLYTCKFRVQVEAIAIDYSLPAMRKPIGEITPGWSDFFQVGPMAGGWDEVAWAGHGLPISGQLSIKLTVSDVPHAAVPQVP